MSSSASLTTTATPVPRPAHLHDEDDLRPSSTSVVATLRHSPRLLLRKKASALKEPAQSPDIFARGPGPSLRASTRLQTRNTSAKLLKTRTKKASRQQLQLQQERTDNQLSQYTNSNNKTSSITTTTTTTTTTFSSTRTTTMLTHGGHHLDSTNMALDGPVQTRSRSTTIMVTEPSIASSHSSTNPTSRIHAASGQSPTSIAAEEASMERRSRIATRSFSQTRETTRTRSSRTRARARTIPTKALKVPGDDEEKSDEDDDDEEESRFRYHLRSPGHHRRPRSLQKTATSDTTVETTSISNLTLTPRLTRLGARHESGHGFEDEPDQEQSHQHNRHLENVEKGQPHGRRSRSATSSSSQDSQAAKSKAATTTYSSPGAQAAPRKVKKKSVGHHKVPSLPASRRRLRARTTKVAKMGVDEEDEDDEEEDEDEEEEEDEDVDFDPYRRNEQDADMMDVEPPSSGLPLRSQVTEDNNTQSNHDGLDGFIASKPEASLVAAAGGLASYLSAQAIHHAKRKVEDEDMEDAPALSVDEGQVVSTKLARIDETSDGDKNTYLKTFYNILKSPRGDGKFSGNGSVDHGYFQGRLCIGSELMLTP
ncbi:hypothetical protein EDD21DRAFT_52818 [Dissophora ornata]|nr:hypothetical protein EDD21DRAFT_52818 [Dissophora ornata]